MKYIRLFKEHILIILTLGFAYGAIISFSLFGPVLNKASVYNADILTLIALIFFVLGFYLRPRRIESERKFYIIMSILFSPIILFYYALPFYLKVIGIILYSFMLIRIGCLWTFTLFYHIDYKNSGKIIASALGLAFFLLYFLYAITPSVDIRILTIIPLTFSTLAVCFFFAMKKKYSLVNVFKVREKKLKEPYYAYVLLIVVYIAGGFSYAEIFNHLDNVYHHVDRFYYVLPFVISVFFAGILLDNKGYMITYILGFSFLGISFVFYLTPLNITSYFFVQTFLQMGWAFVNAFVWNFSMKLALNKCNDIIFSRGVASMLVGTFLGTLLASALGTIEYNYSFNGLIIFIPLFISLVILYIFFNDYHNNENSVDNIEGFEILTQREKEICNYILKGLTNKEISEKLYISLPTVKSHCTNIYRKLDISSRKQMTSLFLSKSKKL